MKSRKITGKTNKKSLEVDPNYAYVHADFVKVVGCWNGPNCKWCKWVRENDPDKKRH